jgi:nitrite reductase/ring-hydroxylating ferredoxin subunit
MTKLPELPAAGRSVRFPLDERREAFAVRLADGTLRAYLNVCPHRAQPVDLGDGRLFNAAGELECAAHGARFDPSTGTCLGGPCEGQHLVPLEIDEMTGEAWVKPFDPPA